MFVSTVSTAIQNGITVMDTPFSQGLLDILSIDSLSMTGVKPTLSI